MEIGNISTKEIVVYGINFTQATTSLKEWMEIAEEAGNVWSLPYFIDYINNTPEHGKMLFKAVLIDTNNPESAPFSIDINRPCYGEEELLKGTTLKAEVEIHL